MENKRSHKTMDESLGALKDRIGCSSITFSYLPLHAALQRIASLGFRTVDIGISPRYCPHIDPWKWTPRDTEKLLEQLHRLDLRVSSLNVVPAGLAARYPEEVEEFIKATFPIGKALNVNTITLQPGPPVDAASWVDTARKAAVKFRRLADAAEVVGVRLSIEAPHTNTLAGNYMFTARLFEFINDPRVGCTFDTSHAQRNDPRPLAEGISCINASIVHVHLRDTLGKKYTFTPGKGRCDYGPFIQQLFRTGYAGDFNLELEGVSSSSTEEVIFARRYLHYVLEGGQIPSEMARWKQREYQLISNLSEAVLHPKRLVQSHPSLMKRLKPLVRFVKREMPTIEVRYETGWRKRLSLRGPNRVSPRKIGSATPHRGEVVRVGVLGCGNVGFNMHGPAFARLPGIEVVGVCDSDAEAASRCARRLKCSAFTDLSELVTRAKPQLVANCTPEWVHAATTIFLLEHGVDVFCEKIMAESIESGEAMVQCAAKHKRILAVNFNWRFLPGILKIKEVKDAGRLGPLYMLRIFCHSWVWHHAIDLVDFLGGGIKSVSAIVRRRPEIENRNPWRRFADEILYLPEVYCIATMETAGGVGATIASSDLWNPGGCLFNMDAVFQKGTVSISGISLHDAIGLISSDAGGVDLNGGLKPYDGPSTFAITFQRSVEKFVTAYRNGQPPPTSGEHGLRIMKIERAIVEASRTGTRILT